MGVVSLVLQPYRNRWNQIVTHVLQLGAMGTVGLRELRQQASELVRRVQDGEEVTITVSGRPSARLVPVAPRTWRHHADIADLFDGPDDPQWASDRGMLDQELIDQAVPDPRMPR